MSGAVARLNGRFTRLAVGRHLTYRTVRARLTLLYGGLFVISGAALMATAYLLLVNAGFIFSLPGGTAGSSAPPGSATPANSATGQGFPHPGLRTHPAAQTMSYWRGVAVCMRRHGVSGFPEPRDRVPASRSAVAEVSDRNGAILLFPIGLNQQSPAFSGAANTCGFYADNTQQFAAENSQRVHVREQLLIQSGLALTAMALLSLGLGWFLAGRVLQPLEAAHEAERQFVANASHELRAPLTRQRALIQVALADPHADGASLRAAHERVLAAELHLEQMINGLLTLTRGQAGLERRDEVDLAAVLVDVLRAHETEACEHQLTITTVLEPAPVAGDPRLIERLVANVISNAIRHNLAGGQVEIATGTRERAAFVSIANSGPVVADEQVERLFRPFERLGPARTGHDGGHGLGLAIVRAVADAHRAELSVHARPEGGLLVEVVFPASRSGARALLAAGRLRRLAPRTPLGD